MTISPEKIISFLFLRTLLSVLVVIVICNLIVLMSTGKRNKQVLKNLPDASYGLLLGTGPFIGKAIVNNHYLVRVQAAVQAFRQKKISRIIVSGGWFECKEMVNDLTANGIPRECIISDTAGFNTFDSIRNTLPYLSRGEHLLIITQQFHAYRALFICRGLGIEALAYAPGFRSTSWKMVWPLFRRGKTAILPREWLARTKACGQIVRYYFSHAKVKQVKPQEVKKQQIKKQEVKKQQIKKQGCFIPPMREYREKTSRPFAELEDGE